MLYSKIHKLEDVAIVLKYARSLNRLKPPVIDIASNLSDDKTDSYDSTVSLSHIAHNISLLHKTEHAELQQTLYLKTHLPNKNKIQYKKSTFSNIRVAFNNAYRKILKMLMVLCTLFININIIPFRQKIHLI